MCVGYMKCLLNLIVPFDVQKQYSAKRAAMPCLIYPQPD